MHVSRRLLLTLAAAALVSPAAALGQSQSLPTSDLVVVSGDRRHRFRVELANTDQTRAVGLMNRKALAPDAGMLFDFGQVAPVAMWMKNTLIPLDMLFIAADGRVVNVHERAIPHDLSSIPSAGPVLAVLELNGGTAARLGLKPGDRVEHPIFSRGR